MCHLSGLLVKGGKYHLTQKLWNSTTNNKIQDKLSVILVFHGVALCSLIVFVLCKVIYILPLHFNCYKLRYRLICMTEVHIYASPLSWAACTVCTCHSKEVLVKGGITTFHNNSKMHQHKYIIQALNYVLVVPTDRRLYRCATWVGYWSTVASVTLHKSCETALPITKFKTNCTSVI
jgi:hypothetical protein